MLSAETEYYFERFGFCGRGIDAPPHPNLGMVVVIPCFNEPDLLAALDSLRHCVPPKCAVEIIVVVNSGEHATPEILEQNSATLADARAWITAHSTSDRIFHLLHAPNLPQKKAGVGLARKIGMDEALRRLDQVKRLQAPIVCFDADCLCEPNYLVSIEEYFERHDASPGCSIYFEHPLTPPVSEAKPSGILQSAFDHSAPIFEAIILYELHLRYYVQGLRWANYPFAFHTIGSSMAVRAEIYRKQGGMNKRQAGEDFYFLHKVIPLGNFGDLTTTTVHASPRPSERVPFGTGRAVREYLETGVRTTYPFQAFADLRKFFVHTDSFHNNDWKPHASEALQIFLQRQDFNKALSDSRAHSRSLESFRKRLFWWFDGFRVMKFIHHARDNFYGPQEIPSAAAHLWRQLTKESPVENPRELLLKFRNWERRGYR